jgi:hypothetical protein
MFLGELPARTHLSTLLPEINFTHPVTDFPRKDGRAKSQMAALIVAPGGYILKLAVSRN